MREPKYSSGDDFARPEINFGSDRRIVFFTGLGLPMRNQGEPFVRRFALLNHISYLALDFDAITANKTEKENFGLETAFDRAMDKISKLKEERLIFVGPCFGGLMAYRAAQEFPNKVETLLASSPLIDFEQGTLSQHIDVFLNAREERFKKRNIPAESLQKMHHFRQSVVLGTSKYGRLPVTSSYLGPVCILHGEKDRLVPIENSRQIARKLNRPNVTVQEIPSAGHTFDMDQDRRMKFTIATLKKHLAR